MLDLWMDGARRAQLETHVYGQAPCPDLPADYDAAVAGALNYWRRRSTHRRGRAIGDEGAGGAHAAGPGALDGAANDKTSTAYLPRTSI